MGYVPPCIVLLPKGFEQRNAPGWISVGVARPDHGDFIWIFTPKDGVELAYWWNGFINASGAGDREGLNSETLYPTHWMPLDQPNPLAGDATPEATP
jgi:hypothetical protein